MVPDSEFKVNTISGIVFTHDLKKVFLIPNSSLKFNPDVDIYDTFSIPLENGKDDKLELSKQISKYGLVINPTSWRDVIRIKQFQKDWQTTVYMSLLNLESQHDKNFYDVFNLPLIAPHLQWLIPMAIDPQVYGTTYNQILFV
jgi:hypothetical protein